MIARPYEPADREPVEAIAARAGVRFTDPEYRLHRLAFVAEKEGRPVACIVARRTAEVILMLDPDAGTQLERLHVLKELWPTFSRAVFAAGVDSLIVPIEPSLRTFSNGLVVSRYGFRRDVREHLTFDLVDSFSKGADAMPEAL